MHGGSHSIQSASLVQQVAGRMHGSVPSLSLCVVAIYSDWSRDHDTSTPLKPKWYKRAAAGVFD
jgi:hypothetical protein